MSYHAFAVIERCLQSNLSMKRAMSKRCQNDSPSQDTPEFSSELHFWQHFDIHRVRFKQGAAVFDTIPCAIPHDRDSAEPPA